MAGNVRTKWLLLASLILSVLRSAFGQLSLPLPEGPHAVGFTSTTLVTARSSDSDKDRRRELVLQVWYPATPEGKPRSYMDPNTAAAVAENLKFPAGFERQVVVTAHLDAPTAEGRFPIIVFSHGLGWTPFLYQSLLEDLASRGHVVIAVTHPSGAAVTLYPDGRSIALAPRFKASDAEPAINQEVDTWVQDFKDIVDALARSNWLGQLSAHLDLKHIVLAGHSLGGTAAVRAACADDRVAAAIALEGKARRKDKKPEPINKPVMHMMGGYNRLELEGSQYEVNDGGTLYEVILNGTGHTSFSDVVYVYRNFADSAWKARHRYELDPARAIQITRDYFAAFLDHTFAGTPSVLLKPVSYAAYVDNPRTSGYPEVVLRISAK